MFSSLGNMIIDSITVFDDTSLNIITSSVLGLVCYITSYRITGIAYRNDIIGSKAGGSLLHWIIRIPMFLILSYIVRFIYYIYTLIQG